MQAYWTTSTSKGSPIFEWWEALKVSLLKPFVSLWDWAFLTFPIAVRTDINS